MTRRETIGTGLAAAGLAAAWGVWPGRLLAAGPGSAVVVNQAGYRPGLPKRALLIRAGARPVAAALVDLATRRPVRNLTVEAPRRDPSTGEAVAVIDFSAVDTPGRYAVRCGDLESRPFVIDDIAYDLAFVTMLRTYYFQRCGTAVQDPITGLRHAACHRQDGVLARGDRNRRAGEAIDASGGWHDAGDYGKYVATTAVTIGRLLSIYEQHPELFSDGQLTIPESGNGVPDLLDEVAVGLEWLLKMQRPDGAVYRKLAGTQWPGNVLPETDGQQRLVYGVSTPETAKTAAALAMAARLYRRVRPQQASRYLDGARRGWAYLQGVREQQVDWAASDDVASGKYLLSEIDNEASLTYDWDDRLWAAAELFLTTGERPFEEAVAALVPRAPYTLFEWKDPSALGLSNLLFAADVPDRRGLRNQIRDKLLKRADAILARVGRGGYRIGVEQLKWGSNKMAAEEGITLVHAWRLTQRRDYLAAAVDQLDYLLGRNAFDKSFVTGVGSNPVLRVHNRLAIASGVYLPGFLVNGPFPGATDKVAPTGRGLLSYVDDERSYATNENAIDYNASMIALMGMLMAISPDAR